MADDHVMLKGDQGEALIFRWGSERNNFFSTELKRGVFDEVLTVEVITPGSKESSPVLELLRKFDPETALPDRQRDHLIQRYRRQYDAFMAGNAGRDVIGTPIEQWPTATRRWLRGARKARSIRLRPWRTSLMKSCVCSVWGAVRRGRRRGHG
jgi:hypothetical protein